MVHELPPAEELLDRAVAVAELTPEDCLGQYAFTKRACQASALRDIAELADPLDGALPEGMTSDQARHAHPRYWQQLNKGSPAPCGLPRFSEEGDGSLHRDLQDHVTLTVPVM